MDSFNETSGLLEIYVSHARNIHNICIYDNQDVYAKFSLTYNPDETISTKIVNGGGKNPRFNETLRMKITQLDSVLKCEIWMLSRARNYLDDQLLGFTLVPMSLVAGKGEVTQDFTLSSTDLFHSPAGTVQLTLFLNTSVPVNLSPKSSDSALNSSITSEVVLLDPVEYSRLEFPDMNVVRENQQMVSEYFHNNNSSSCLPDGFDMNSCGSVSTTTSLSDDRNSSIEFKSHGGGANQPDTPTSKKESGVQGEKDGEFSNKMGEGAKENDSVFAAPLGNINMEAEQTAMQQQIVDMYMRSMQQFTESLAKMKLPMDLDHKPESHEHHSDVIQQHKKKIDMDKKKDGSRLFYGSRAFF